MPRGFFSVRAANPGSTFEIPSAARAPRRLYLVCYDISLPARWRKVFRLMQGYGEWVQLSVFRCRLTIARRERLEESLIKRIKVDEDRVIIADLGPLPGAETRLLSLGNPLPPANVGPWIA